MSREEQLQGSKGALSYSPSRGSPARSRLYVGVGPPQRLQQRSLSSAKKPPEPLRRAVADCLSSPALNVHGNPSSLTSEAARILRDYIATPSTTDLAYHVLLEHAIAERERSPAVISRCVALLKRYLLRYVPKVETLRQIDNFCANAILECDSIPNRRMSSSTKLSSRLSGGSSTSGSASPYSLPAHSFASPSLVKSLNYVRSLVARHIPRLSFQQVPPIGPANAGKQPLQTLSTLLRRSFNSHLSPESVNSHESPERKEVLHPSTLNLSNVEKIEAKINNNYIYNDLLKWRWPGMREQSSSTVMESDSGLGPQDAQIHGFLEVGAAALLVGDLKGPDIDQFLQPSTVTTANDFASSRNHLRAITASKRLKPGPHQFWVNAPLSTFNPRARTLFQYRHYSEQQPLRLNPAEISDVIAAVCTESSSPTVNLMTTSSRLTSHSGKPSCDIAVSVLIKLVIDMYVMDSGTAAPLTLTMLEDMLLSQRVVSRVRVFDILLNLGIHAHLLEPVLFDDPSSIGDRESSLEYQFNRERQLTAGREAESSTQQHSSAIDNFESFLLVILFETLLLLVQVEEREEIVWASALSCLFYFVCDRGKIRRSRLEGLDIRVIKALLEISREHAWAQIVRCKLICMLTNMFYQVSDMPTFVVEQVDLIGGVEFICLEYSHANSREEKRDLFLVLFDYVLHQINDNCLATGSSAYSSDEIQPLATMLVLAEAPEAFYIALKHGVEGIGEILRRSIAAALSRSPNYERLNLLLEKTTRKLDGIISLFTCLDTEFSYMIWITKSHKSSRSLEVGHTESEINMKAKLSWATLQALLHSERAVYRHNGYIWLVELLLSEISEEGNKNIWLNVKSFQQHMGTAGSQDSSFSSVPLPICILCGLLKSKHNSIRWGFLFVLEKLLMRCKLLLDENGLQHLNGVEASCHDNSDSRLEKANAVVDIMSSALALVVQITETDRINILKMCDILFSQLCLRLLPTNSMPTDNMKSNTGIGNTDVNILKHEKTAWNNGLLEDTDTVSGLEQAPLFYETASMAALLLRGCAVVPIQLIARVPVSLFYWPLFQLAAAATDDIALGVAVGSKGRGNLAGNF
uniref:SANT domain-containing protein 2 n=1 Tax=Anthurium amnicola TaxID=1678845 RepID=A0A1D1YJE2_9ARAE